MKAIVQDLYIEKGSLFKITFRIKTNTGVLDLTPYSFRGQIKASAQDTLSLASFEFEKTVDNRVYIKLPISESNNLPATGKGYNKLANYYYDIEMYKTDDLTDVTRIMNGIVEVSPEVTR